MGSVGVRRSPRSRRPSHVSRRARRRVQFHSAPPFSFLCGACMSHSYSHDVITIGAASPRAHVLLRSFIIGLTAFLTVVDLFATQAILPSLARAYQVSPAAIGFAVNASTIGMAIAGLAVAFFSNRIDRRRGILVSLTLLSIPTALLAIAPNLTVFTLLRIAQGLC